MPESRSIEETERAGMTMEESLDYIMGERESLLTRVGELEMSDELTAAELEAADQRISTLLREREELRRIVECVAGCDPEDHLGEIRVYGLDYSTLGYIIDVSRSVLSRETTDTGEEPT